MAKKSDRKIVHKSGISYGDQTFKPGDEAELAKVAPQWNLAQMKQKGWLEGDWSNAGITPEQEAKEAAAATAATTAAKTGRK